MHQTQFSEKIPYGGFSQIRSHMLWLFATPIDSTFISEGRWSKADTRLRDGVTLVVYISYSQLPAAFVTTGRSSSHCLIASKCDRLDRAKLLNSRLRISIYIPCNALRVLCHLSANYIADFFFSTVVHWTWWSSEGAP